MDIQLKNLLETKFNNNVDYVSLTNDLDKYTQHIPSDPIVNRINACMRLFQIILGRSKFDIDEDTHIINLYNFSILLYEIVNYGNFDKQLIKEAIQLSAKTFALILDLNPFHKQAIVGLRNTVNKITSVEDNNLNVVFFEKYSKYIGYTSTFYLSLGFFYDNINMFDDSLHHYKLSICLNDKTNETLNINLYNNIYTLLYKQEKYKESLHYLLEGLSLSPNDPDLNAGLGVIYMKIDKPSLAEAAFKKSIKYFNNSLLSNDKNKFLALTYSNYAFFCDRTFDYKKAAECYKLSQDLNPKLLTSFQSTLMGLNFKKYSYDNRMFSSNEHRKINEHYEKTRLYEFNSSFFNQDKINIGFVSGDFKMSHAVYFFLSTFIHKHNPNLFNITCYAENDCNIPHVLSKKIRGMSTGDVSDVIYNDNIHILFDLSGHTSLNRLDVFKNKPSPIQISYIGYPFTSGINEMDYRITDSLCEHNLEISQQYYTEKLLCLDNCFLCYEQLIKPDLVENIPDEKYITIGCYNRPNKMSVEFLSLINKILSSNEKVKFIFNSPAHKKENIRNVFLENFKEEYRERISFVSPSADSMVKQLETYNKINIQLDTFPYSGTTTSCESLLMGVPPLSIYDKETCYHVQNVTNSILINSDLGYYSCDTEDEILNKIVELQNKPQEFWSNFKSEVRDKFLNGKVCNQKLYVTNIQKLLVNLYNKHKVNPVNPEKYYQDFLNKEWEVDWKMLPLHNEELECVIVEPRCHDNLLRVIKNFCSKLNKYSFTWFCSKENYHFLDDKLPEEALKKIKRVCFTDGNIDIFGYNNLLVSSNFWDSFKSKRVLIFQTDTACLKNNIEDFLKYDYIGSPWNKGHCEFNKNPIDLCCGNGGLTIRNTKLMKQICENSNPLYNKFPEDFFFCNHIFNMTKVRKDIVFPQTIEEASFFGSETIINNESFGTHAVYKYHSADKIKELFNV